LNTKKRFSLEFHWVNKLCNFCVLLRILNILNGRWIGRTSCVAVGQCQHGCTV
jgi:hypothetical protein